MRRVLVALFAVALVGGGATLAQDMAPSQNMYAGASFGVASVFGLVGFPVVGHFGVENVGMDNLDIRGDLGFYVTGSGIEIGANAIYNYPVQEQINVYGGAGPRLLFGGGSAVFGLAVLGGAEYMVTPNIGLYGEPSVSVYFGGGLGVAVYGLQFGANYHF